MRLLLDPSYDSYAPAVALSGGVKTHSAYAAAFSRRLAGVFGVATSARGW